MNAATQLPTVLDATTGVGCSNAVITYFSDIEWPGDEYRDDRESNVWCRAELILRAFNAFTRSDKRHSYEDALDGLWPSPDWSFTCTEADFTYVVLGSKLGAVAVYRLDSRHKLKRLKRWPATVKQAWELDPLDQMKRVDSSGKAIS